MYSMCICGSVKRHLLLMTRHNVVYNVQIILAALKLVNRSNFSLNTNSVIPKAFGEMKDGSELTWLVSDVEADDEKAKGLTDEMIKIRVKIDTFNLLWAGQRSGRTQQLPPPCWLVNNQP